MIVLDDQQRGWLALLVDRQVEWSKRRQLPFAVVHLWNERLVTVQYERIIITELGREVAHHVL